MAFGISHNYIQLISQKKKVILFGNNVLEVYSALQDLENQIAKNPKPVILECMTFRMRGHEEASG